MEQTGQAGSLSLARKQTSPPINADEMSSENNTKDTLSKLNSRHI